MANRVVEAASIIVKNEIFRIYVSLQNCERSPYRTLRFSILRQLGLRHEMQVEALQLCRSIGRRRDGFSSINVMGAVDSLPSVISLPLLFPSLVVQASLFVFGI